VHFARNRFQLCKNQRILLTDKGCFAIILTVNLFNLQEAHPMTYSQKVLEDLKIKNPDQPEFIQAATEVLDALARF